jgi:hypothetical protein
MLLHFTTTELVMVFSLVTGLVSLWLRLSWKTRQEQARRGTLIALARALPVGSELEEQAADGTRLRITMAAADRTVQPEYSGDAGPAPTGRPTSL